MKFYNNQIDNNKADSKEMWKCLKALIKGGSQDNIRKEIVFQKHGIVSDEEKICNYFNEYFIDSIQEIIDVSCNTMSSNTKIDLEYMKTTSQNWDKFDTITLPEIKSILKTIGNKKSSVDVVIFSNVLVN